MPRTKASQADLFDTNSLQLDPERLELKAASAVGHFHQNNPRETAAEETLKVANSTRAAAAAVESGAFLTDTQVARRYGVSRPTVWRWCKTNPGFPSPKQISPGTTRWALSDLHEFDSGLRSKSRRNRAAPVDQGAA